MEQRTKWTWTELNAYLLTTEDEQSLQSLLDFYKSANKVSRAMRVYGRLSAVRRMREIREIRRKCKRD